MIFNLKDENVYWINNYYYINTDFVEKIVASNLTIFQNFAFIDITTNYQSSYNENKVFPFIELIYQDSYLLKFIIKFLERLNLKLNPNFEFEFRLFRFPFYSQFCGSVKIFLD